MDQETFTENVEAAVLDMPFANTAPIEWGKAEWTHLSAVVSDLLANEASYKGSCYLCAGKCRGHSFGMSWEPEPGSAAAFYASAAYSEVEQAFRRVLGEIEPAKGYAESCGLEGGKLPSAVHIKLDMIAGYAREGLTALGKDDTGNSPAQGRPDASGN